MKRPPSSRLGARDENAGIYHQPPSGGEVMRVDPDGACAPTGVGQAGFNLGPDDGVFHLQQLPNSGARKLPVLVRFHAATQCDAV